MHDYIDYNFNFHFQTLEELPNQEPTTKPDSVNNAPTEGVEEALEEVKKIISFYGDEEKTVFIEQQHYQLPNHSDEMFRGISNLVNALDKSLAHPNTQKTPVSSIVGQARDIVSAKTDKVGSIWKPISELPRSLCDVYIKLKGGEIISAKYFQTTGFNQKVIAAYGLNYKQINDVVVEYCTLTDFTTNQENLERRIERLEQSIKQNQQDN